MTAIMIGHKESGEVVSIEKAYSYNVKALKKWVRRQADNFGVAPLYVIESSDVKLGDYFEKFIGNLQPVEREKIFVGVSYKPLLDFLYEENDVRPLHIAQSLSSNYVNTKTALDRDDKEWLKELYKERYKLYDEALFKYGLDMTEMNDFLWGEYKHTLTDNKFIDKYFFKCEACNEYGTSWLKNKKLCILCDEELEDLLNEVDEDDEDWDADLEDYDEAETKHFEISGTIMVKGMDEATFNSQLLELLGEKGWLFFGTIAEEEELNDGEDC